MQRIALVLFLLCGHAAAAPIIIKAAHVIEIEALCGRHVHGRFPHHQDAATRLVALHL